MLVLLGERVRAWARGRYSQLKEPLGKKKTLHAHMWSL
jgi:hypothetical protein